ncbi:MAG: redox-regulated ATPase YchF [Planctomycetes bacterium]|nr:redox-regulated ATPase YchF [Planctomycetota bacterium]
MSFNCGIVGLPNVGKTTIFNAVTNAGADEENFPFSTVEPNRQMVPIPDRRLDALVEFYSPKKTVPASLEMVDIAGLVKGSSKGEGIGNQFLGHIKDVDAIIHVVRCFEDPDIPHTYDTIDPARDVEDIDLELIFKDIETVNNKISRIVKKTKNDKHLMQEMLHCQKIVAALEEGIPARKQDLNPAEREAIFECMLLSVKPVLYIANVKEGQGKDDAYVQALQKLADAEGAGMVVVAGRAEAEIAELDEADRAEFMEALGLEESSLGRLMHEGYRTLNLITMFTYGETECHAWTIPSGTKAPQAAGKIHTDLEKGFIRMEVIPVEALIEFGGHKEARAHGKFKVEGKDYIVQDGDAVHVLFNK